MNKIAIEYLVKMQSLIAECGNTRKLFIKFVQGCAKHYINTLQLDTVTAIKEASFLIADIYNKMELAVPSL